MKFGIFDHMDRGSVPLSEHYENRLKLIEAYDRAGFYSYHLAEHHATPLGMAPSPAVFLAAVAQRSKRLRFGPLVYILSLQNPMRAYEDICMLDQLSGGRLDLGIGRGISPIEIGYYGVDPDAAPSIYKEAVDVIMQAFKSDTLTFHGKHFKFDNAPIELKPVQQPHPPIWLGIGKPEGVRHAAENKINMVCNGTPDRVRVLTDRYREEWSKLGGKPGDIPIMGMNRHIVIADTEAEAMRLAEPAYVTWYNSLHLLWKRHGLTPPGLGFRPEFSDAVRNKFVMVGTPQAVREMIDEQTTESGVNYLMCRVAFGDLPYEATARTVELFVRDVMPRVKQAA